MPHANGEAMQHHLDDIARIVAPGAHGLVVLDQAAWHTTDKLRLLDNLAAAIAVQIARTEPGGECLAVSCAETNCPT
jgi:hypothetical protein